MTRCQKKNEMKRGAKAIQVDGYSNFLFLNRDGLPKVSVNYDAMFKCLAKKFNKCHKEPLPSVMTPHTMRHTFCTVRNGQTGSESGSQREEHGGSQGCCLVVSRYFTTCSTTFHRENMRGYESICEFLPIWKTPGKPEVTGYTGI